MTETKEMSAETTATADELVVSAPAKLAEETTVGRAQDGDVASFETLLRRYQGPVYRLANKMLFDRGDAEDVVQDTFVAVWRRLPTLVDPGVFRSWVYQIATRQCLAVLRARARRATHVLEAEELQAAHDHMHAQDDQPDDPAASAQHAAQMRGLDVILQTLPDDQRACWVLRELHELTYIEIAYAINLPPPTVRGRIARARQNIAKGNEHMEVTTSPTASTSPTSSDPNRSATQLGCGRSIDDVWGNAENPPTTHEMGCPYCRAARSDLAGLRKATRDLHQQDTTDTDLQAGPGVLDRILAIARAEVRRGRGLPLDRVRPGRASDLTVSEQTVTALIRRAGDRTEHIQIRRCAIEVVDDANDRSADTGSIKRSRSGSEPAGVKCLCKSASAKQLPSSALSRN